MQILTEMICGLFGLQQYLIWIIPLLKMMNVLKKKEFITMLDKLQAVGINTVMVQVRPKADAFYKSSINPWSESLTGTQGKDPGYDPMAFMISETHKRGMSFHAWLNPYRVTNNTTDINTLAANHPARQHPEWLFEYNGALYYNPELSGVNQHVVDTVKEIVQNYDVDGLSLIHISEPTRLGMISYAVFCLK